MSDHECLRCIQCGSCPVCAADALDCEVVENERLRLALETATRERDDLTTELASWRSLFEIADAKPILPQIEALIAERDARLARLDTAASDVPFLLELLHAIGRTGTRDTRLDARILEVLESYR